MYRQQVLRDIQDDFTCDPEEHMITRCPQFLISYGVKIAAKTFEQLAPRITNNPLIDMFGERFARLGS